MYYYLIITINDGFAIFLWKVYQNSRTSFVIPVLGLQMPWGGQEIFTYNHIGHFLALTGFLMSEMFVISVNSNQSQLHLHSQFAIWKVKLQPGEFTCAKTGTRWQTVYLQYFNQPEPGDMRAKQRAKTVITFPVDRRLREFISICCFHWKSAISVSIWLLITRILFGIIN